LVCNNQTPTIVTIEGKHCGSNTCTYRVMGCAFGATQRFFSLFLIRFSQLVCHRHVEPFLSTSKSRMAAVDQK